MSNAPVNNQSLDNLVLSNMPSSVNKSQALPQPRVGLLSIPLELRLEIYKEVSSKLNSIIVRGIHDWNNCRNDNDWPKPISLFQVCKQIHFELVATIYRKVEISYPFNRWIDCWTDFFHKIGPRNGAFIQDITIGYFCHRDLYDHGKCFRDESHMYEHDRYEDLFKSLAYANVKPHRLKLDIRPCIGIPSQFFTERDYGHDYARCQVYKDLRFLSHLSIWFGKIQEISLNGRFNPLWAFALRQRLGFIIKREYPSEPIFSYPSYFLSWTLINPKFFNPATDLSGYSPSGSISGVYTKIREGSTLDDLGWAWISRKH
ncbi:hypothetical protein F5Y06DRAFT_91551 [Hypoxylon sp. FL0890]|nr:hypothetical protein F5Y06DRAFT_91551 [Hypoxylon sp. FL0890]